MGTRIARRTGGGKDPEFLSCAFSYVRNLQRIAGGRPQLDGSGLRRFHVDSSVEAVKTSRTQS